MNLFDIKPGMTVEIKDGSTAEVLENMDDGQWLRVRYLTAPKHPELVDEEELCHAESVAGLKPAC